MGNLDLVESDYKGVTQQIMRINENIQMDGSLLLRGRLCS